MARRLKGSARFALFGVELLRGQRNLLGFSYGADSACLFHLLRDLGVGFDLAMVDYGVRKSAKIEVAAAKKLAKKHGKKIFIAHAPRFLGNFEAEARSFRYAFFERIILEGGYENLITAHQLNDRVEWLLMSLCRGGGLCSLLGFAGVENREILRGDFAQDSLGDSLRDLAQDSRGDSLRDSPQDLAGGFLDSQKDSPRNYRIIRPLCLTSRAKIEKFLRKNDLKFFRDETNADERFLRNFFRQNFAAQLVGRFEAGLLRSFEILEGEKAALFGAARIFQIEGVFVFAAANLGAEGANLANLAANLGVNLGGANPKNAANPGANPANPAAANPAQNPALANLHFADLCAKKLGYVFSQKQRREILKCGFSCVVGGKIALDCGSGWIFVGKNKKRFSHDKKIRESFRQSGVPPRIRPLVGADFLLGFEALKKEKNEKTSGV